MRETIKQDFPIVYGIVELFDSIFNIENVDVKRESSGNYTIYIHFPKITITNSNGCSHDIYDLYVKLTVSTEGKLIGYFKMLRATVTYDEYECGYEFSHKPTHEFMSWNTTCLGEGPLVHTISILNDSYDYDRWMIFCKELDNYVRWESLEGGPYIKIDSISKRSIKLDDHSPELLYIRPKSYTGLFAPDNIQILDEFKQYFLENNSLKFNFKQCRYDIAMSYSEFTLYLTKELFKFLKAKNNINYCTIVKDFIHDHIIVEGSEYEGQIYSGEKTNLQDTPIPEDTYMFTFKDNQVYFRVTTLLNDIELGGILLLSTIFVDNVYSTITTLLNCYGKELSERTLFM